MSESQTGAGNHKFQSLNVIENFENLAKWGQKLHYSPLSLYNGTFGGPMTKWGQKLDFSPLSLYYGTIGGPFSQYYGTFGGPLAKWDKNSTFPQSACTMVHCVAHWQSGPKIALFPTQPLLWYIWWPTGKAGPKIVLFLSQPVL